MKLSPDPLILQPPELTNIGIIYATANGPARGREEEKVADIEVIEVAEAIYFCLKSCGYQVETVAVDPDNLESLRRFDWIFNLVESMYGFPLSDDQVAAQLERLNLPFTGSGSTALSVCRDKAKTKSELSHYGLLTPAYEVYPQDILPAASKTRLRFPLIVKPLAEDGSFGINRNSRVETWSQLVYNVKCIHEMYRQPALVEEFIEGKDVNASILGNDENALVLPLSEMTYVLEDTPQFLTFDAKWLPNTDEYQSAKPHCPASLEPAVASLIEQQALKACRIMGCCDYVRVDFRLKGNIPYILEVNPNPCINPHDSGFVRSGLAGGYTYASLIEEILHNSMHRMAEVHESLDIEADLSS
jgi:D-alanine-D-alanine ligase